MSYSSLFHRGTFALGSKQLLHTHTTVTAVIAVVFKAIGGEKNLLKLC